MKSAPFTADSGSAAKLRRDWLAPGFNPTLTSAGQALATVARSFASASGPGSQATTSSPWARQRAAQPPPITPPPTRATRRMSFTPPIAHYPFVLEWISAPLPEADLLARFCRGQNPRAHQANDFNRALDQRAVAGIDALFEPDVVFQ